MNTARTGDERFRRELAGADRTRFGGRLFVIRAAMVWATVAGVVFVKCGGVEGLVRQGMNSMRSWTGALTGFWCGPVSEGESRCVYRAIDARLFDLGIALGVFEVMAGRYPTQEEGLGVLVKEGRRESARRIRKLLDEVPRDDWGRPLQYRIPAVRSGGVYDLFSLGPDGVPSGDDIGNW